MSKEITLLMLSFLGLLADGLGARELIYQWEEANTLSDFNFFSIVLIEVLTTISFVFLIYVFSKKIAIKNLKLAQSSKKRQALDSEVTVGWNRAEQI